MSRMKMIAALLMPLAFLAPVGAQDVTPAALVRVRSIDAAIDGVRTLAKLALDGNDGAVQELFKKVEGEIKSKVGLQAVKGIDRTRPLGAYVRLGKEVDDISGAVLIPVEDEKKFLAFVESFPVTVEALAGGVYSLGTGIPVELYLKFGNGYAYVTAMNKRAFDSLADPAKILGAKADGPLLQGYVRFDQVPETARQLALAAFEDKLQEESNKTLPNETPAGKAFRVAAMQEVTRAFKGLLNDGQEASLTFDIDGKAKKVRFESSVSAKSGSDLNKAFAGLGAKKSQFAEHATSNAAVRAALNLAFPESVSKAFNKLIDESASKSKDSIADAEKKKQAQDLFDALNPTLKSGELDLLASLIGPGPNKKYVAFAAVKVGNGNKLHATLLALLDDVLKQAPDAVKALIKINVDEIDGVKIHRFDVPTMGADQEKIERIVGALQLSIAIRDDAAFVALGSEGQAFLKEALKTKSSASAPVAGLDVNVGRLIEGLEGNIPEAARERILQVMKEANLPSVRASIEGGATLRGSVEVPFAVIQALAPKAVKGQ